MQKYKCLNCSYIFTEADRAWDVAISSGKCPKCLNALRNFNVPFNHDIADYEAITELDLNDNYQSSFREDFSWTVLIANFFLIGIIAFVQTIIKLQGISNSSDQIFGSFLGGVMGLAVISLIPVAVFYLTSPNKSNFKTKKIFTLSAWCIVIIMSYPIFS